MAALITLDTYKQMIKAGEAFDIAESFNARVGDEQVPLVVKFLERGKVQQFEDGLVPFMSGFVGNLDDKGKVTAETGEPVSYTGTRSDIVGLGMVKMNLPGTMFPQEGYFYGFLGLETPDHSKRVSTFSVWFHVYNGNPDMFVNREPFRSELQKELDRVEVLIEQTEGTIKAKLIEWEKLITDLINNKNIDLEQLESRMATAEGNLKILEDKIKADGLLTQADLDNALKPISDLMNELNALDEVSIEVDGGTVEPFKTSLSSFKNTINNNSGVARIALLQDIHYQRAPFSGEYGEATTRGLIHIQHFGTLKDVLDLAVYNGDNVHGREAKSNTINRIKQLINTHQLAFDDLPTMWTIGNHDDNNIYFIGEARNENILTLAELENAFEINKTYGYRDFEDKKLRVIVLDSFENPEIIGKDGLPKYTRDYSSVFSANQLTWLSKTLEVPTGYSVIAFTHVPPLGYCNNKPYNDYRNVNHDLMLGLFNAFVEGTSYTASGTNTDYPAQVNVDYSNQGKGNLIGIVTGHEHRDVEPQVINGVRVIERTCNLPVGAGRLIGDISEEAFDVIEINSVNKHCKFNRFGAGNSLEFDY
ncbi:metallophosphoesterase [Pediococcus pentosaceus]|uniref:metallophosphoesterase family protein n=1 Tax=Pediococcus pentosaceus TaxID=1255 RepID=UPI001C92F0F2|nr:metallophosphoesterase [Pediococcus pentosaceus]MBY4581351.1 metallophosphoesterase [Pediococcus pentosaceus]